MRDFNGGRKPSGFGGGSSFKGRSEGRGGFGRSSDRGGFSGRSGGDRGFAGRSGGDRGGRSFGGDSFERIMYKAVCSECGKNCEVPFKPTGMKPVLCSTCFSDQQGNPPRESSRDFGSRDFSRERTFEKKMFSAICEGCGDKCEVPFKPVEGKSVFCDDCFRGNESSTKKSEKSTVNYQEQFDALNRKLDQILNALKDTSKVEKIKEIEDVVINKKSKELKIKEVDALVVVEKPKVEKPKAEKVVAIKIAKEAAVKKTTKKKA